MDLVNVKITYITFALKEPLFKSNDQVWVIDKRLSLHTRNEINMLNNFVNRLIIDTERMRKISLI